MNKYRRERKEEVKMRRVEFADMINKPTRNDTKEFMQKSLADAKKRLDESIAENNKAKIKRCKEIMENIQEMMAREESRA